MGTNCPGPSLPLQSWECLAKQQRSLCVPLWVQARLAQPRRLLVSLPCDPGQAVQGRAGRVCVLRVPIVTALCPSHPCQVPTACVCAGGLAGPTAGR